MDTQTVYEYIVIKLAKQNPKTFVWNVNNKNHGFLLGTIKWNGGWRQYCFFPEADTLYSAGCLADIQNFIEQEMEKRKK